MYLLGSYAGMSGKEILLCCIPAHPGTRDAGRSRDYCSRLCKCGWNFLPMGGEDWMYTALFHPIWRGTGIEAECKVPVTSLHKKANLSWF